MRNGQSVGIISRFWMEDNRLKPDESREKTRRGPPETPASGETQVFSFARRPFQVLYKTKRLNRARSWGKGVPSDMPNVKKLRLMFYVLAMIELMLISGYYGWGRMLVR